MFTVRGSRAGSCQNSRAATLTLALLVILLCTIGSSSFAATSFTDIDAGLPGVAYSATAWGDYDNDGDLDLAIAGETQSGLRICRIYKNNGGSFTDINAGLRGLKWAGLAWGDYDNDGDLDLAVAGTSAAGRVFIVYRNDNGAFVDISGDIEPVTNDASIAWGDFDNDGDLDLLFCGSNNSSSTYVTRIYKNTNGSFSSINADVSGVGEGEIAWGDFDNDGDLDFLVVGGRADGWITKVYRNDGGTFTDIEGDFEVGTESAAAWGDYDGDGDLDFVISGGKFTTGYTVLYENVGGTFTNSGQSFPALHSGTLEWGDCDNDGILDLAVTGGSTRTGDYSPISRIYRNNGDGTFSDLGAGLTGVLESSFSWGDMDGDGDLDLVLTGKTISGQYIAKIYRNDGTTANTSPSPPGSFTGNYNGNLVQLQWTPGTDAETPAQALTYNLRVGTSSGSGNILNSPSNLSTGKLKVVSMGNVQENLKWHLTGLAPGTYYWSVQTVDSGYKASSWSTEQTITVANKSISVIQPNGGEAWAGSQTYSILWTTNGVSGNVVLSYSTNSGVDWTVIDTVPAALSNYAWTLPVLDSENCLVRIQSESGNPVDVSDSKFSAHVGNLKLLEPTGSELWMVGESYAITWTAENVASLMIELSRDGGTTWALIADNVDATSLTYTWDATGPKSTTCIVRLTDKDGLAPTRISKKQFVIGLWTFSEKDPGLPNIVNPGVAWGDVDKDGDLDIAISGWGSSGIFLNSGGEFIRLAGSSINAGVYAELAFGDCDNDGDLDIASISLGSSSLYINDAGAFVDSGYHFGRADNDCSVAWGDYDNDGDLDFAIMGGDPSDFTRVVRNNGNGTFEVVELGIADLQSGELAWGDFDSDGDLDLAITGGPPAGGKVTKVYVNNGGVFTDSGNILTGGVQCALAWGDYDNDGDLDLAISGGYGGVFYSKIYKNTDGVLTDINAGLPGVFTGSLAWGDFDNDGDLDLALAGGSSNFPPYGPITKIYRNDGADTFVDIGANLKGLLGCDLAWGDYDNDGKLDLLLAGNYNKNNELTRITFIYKNTGPTVNIAPDPPAALSASIVDHDVTFSWSPGTDGILLASGLTYNLRLGNTPGSNEGFSGMAASDSGWRYLPAMGNVQKNLSWELKNLPSGRYYWSVQSIDTAFAGSSWAPEETFVLNRPPVAKDDTFYSIDEDKTLMGTSVLSNDDDSHGGAAGEDNLPLIASLETGPTYSTSFSLNPDGTFSYTPNSDWYGVDSFTYRATDQLGGVSSIVTVVITVNSVNDGPDTGDDNGYSGDEDETLEGASVLANDSDYHGGALGENNLPLTAELVTGPTHALVFLLNSDGTFIYTPSANYNGFDTFVYKCVDGLGGSSKDTIAQITISPVNDQPIAVILGSGQIYIGESVPLDFSGIGSDIEDGSSLVYDWNWGDGTPNGAGSDPSHLWDTPGTYTVTLVVTDQSGFSSDPTTIEVIVRPKTGERDLFLKRGKFMIDWKAHNDGVDKDTLSVQGWLNPAGCNANLASATFELSVNGVSIGVVPLATNGKGSTATTKACLKGKTGAFSFSIKDADLRTTLGLANTTEAGDLELAVEISVQNAGLSTDTFTAHAQFAYTTKQDIYSKGNFNFKTADSADGYFFAAKTSVTEDKTGKHKVSTKGYFDAPGGESIVPAGDVTLTIGGESITISPTSLTVSGGVISLPKGAHPDLAKFILDTNKELFTILTNALPGTGVPPVGAPVTSHDLLIRIEIPTAGDLVTFETTVEILRSSPTSKTWKR